MSFALKCTYSALTHGLYQGMNSAVQGGEFWAGAAAGALSSIAGSYMNKLGGMEVTNAAGGCSTFGAENANLMVGLTLTSGAIMGGVGADLAGGNFWKGALTGLIVTGLNDLYHRGYNQVKEDKKDSEINVLNDTEGAGGKGHTASVIGLKGKKWYYVSKYAKTDSDGNLDGGLLSGGKSSAVILEYATKAEALANHSEYDQVVSIKTTYNRAVRALSAMYKPEFDY